MKKLLAIMLAGAAVFALTACGKTDDTLTAATNAEFKPFEYLDGDQIVGADIDIANAVAEKLGKKLDIVNIDFDAALTGVATGKYDIAIAGITADDKRRENMDFSSDYYEASQAIIVAADSQIETADDLEGKTISCQEGTTGEQYIIENNYAVQSFKTGAEAIAALTSGKVDAVVIDDQVAKALSAEQNGKTKVLEQALTKEAYAIALQKGNDELAGQINQALAELKQDGTLKQIFEKYDLPVDADAE